MSLCNSRNIGEAVTTRTESRLGTDEHIAHCERPFASRHCLLYLRINHVLTERSSMLHTCGRTDPMPSEDHYAPRTHRLHSISPTKAVSVSSVSMIEHSGDRSIISVMPYLR